jgi:hypothetical protein
MHCMCPLQSTQESECMNCHQNLKKKFIYFFTVNTLCSIRYATVETTTRYTENNTLPLIGTHTCPKLLFVRKTTVKEMQAPARKCARGKRFVLDCANVCILDLGEQLVRCMGSQRETFVQFSKASYINWPQQWNGLLLCELIQLVMKSFKINMLKYRL